MLRAAAGLALLCIMLRGFIPSGYMPDLDQSRERWFALVLCAAAGPMPMAMQGALDRGSAPSGQIAGQAGEHHVGQVPGEADGGMSGHGQRGHLGQRDDSATAHAMTARAAIVATGTDTHTDTHTDADTGTGAHTGTATDNTHHDPMMHAGQDCPFAVAAMQPFVGGVPAISTLTVPMRVARLAPVPTSQHILPPPRAPPLGPRAPPSITV